MPTFIAINLHQLTDSKAKLNIIKVNNHKLKNIATSYQGRRSGDGMAMVYRLLQTGKF